MRRQVVARVTLRLTQRSGYTEEDASKIALWGEGRGRWTSALGFSWSTHRVMGGFADTGCRSMSESVTRTSPCAEGRMSVEMSFPGGTMRAISLAYRHR